MNKLNAERISAVRASLGTDERLIWIGQPSAAEWHLMTRGVWHLILTLLLVVLAINGHASIAAWLSTDSSHALAWPVRVLLFVLALIALVRCQIKLVAAAVPPSYAEQRTAELLYAVTDQRLIHVNGAERLDTPLGDVRWVELTAFDGGTGSISYTTQVYAQQGYPEADTLSWPCLQDAAQVALLICEVAPHARLRDRSPSLARHTALASSLATSQARPLSR